MMKQIIVRRRCAYRMQPNVWPASFFIALLFLIFPTYVVAADVLIDTGPGSTNTIGGLGLFSSGDTTCTPQPACASFFQFLAGQFTLTNRATLSSVEGWMDNISKGSIEIKIRTNSNGLPGDTIFSKTYAPRSQSGVGWVLFEDYETILEAGTYWLTFEPVADTGFDSGMPIGAPNPLPNYAFFNEGNNRWSNFQTPPGLGMRISGTETPSTQFICGGLPPVGWITISVDGICRREGGSFFIGRTIRRIEGLPTDTSIDICGDVAPPGWVTTSVNGICAQVLNSFYHGRTIRKIEGLPTDTSIAICGDAAPEGWITTEVTGVCARVINSFYHGRIIRKIDGLPTDTSMEVCGDVAPPGWITTSVNGICGKVITTSFISRTIRKIEGLPTNTVIEVCGDIPPPGWVTTAISSQACATVGLTSYIKRTIRKIEGLPRHSVVQICGELPPPGWITIAVTGNCARFALTFYTGRTIEKVID
jgi:hypothetical protein